ncbi:MAG TPA: hypothetical protein VL242_07290 [Sorangium sp.]|nr:hypothetical protein [Sorangium sp.]
MVDKAIGAAEEAVIEMDEEVAELQLELDDLDIVAGGVREECTGCYQCHFGRRLR